VTRRLDRLRRTQGCFTDCVAFLLNKHPQRVPFFVLPRKGWMARTRRFFRRHGYKIYWRKTTRVPGRDTHIVCGDSLTWKTFAHVVVYRNGRLVYDPEFPSRWHDYRTTHRLVLVKIR